MRHLIAATLLTAALGTLPAAAQTTEWRGNSLVVTPLAGADCRLPVERAYLQGSGWNASIHLVFRNRGPAPLTATVNVELQGDGQRKSSQHGPFTVVPGATSDRATMAPYGGSLAGSTLRVTFLSCARAN